MDNSGMNDIYMWQVTFSRTVKELIKASLGSEVNNPEKWKFLTWETGKTRDGSFGYRDIVKKTLGVSCVFSFVSRCIIDDAGKIRFLRCRYYDTKSEFKHVEYIGVNGRFLEREEVVYYINLIKEIDSFYVEDTENKELGYAEITF